MNLGGSISTLFCNTCDIVNIGLEIWMSNGTNRDYEALNSIANGYLHEKSLGSPNEFSGQHI